MLSHFFKKINYWVDVDFEDDEGLDNLNFLINWFYFFFYKNRIIKHNSSFIINNNYKIFTLYLTLRYNTFNSVTFLIGYFEKNKFYWTSFNYLPYKLFTRLKPFFSSNIKLPLQKSFHKLNLIKNLIIFKKKTGFLKRRDKIKNFLLLKVNVLRNLRIINTLVSVKSKRIFKKNYIFSGNIQSSKKSHDLFEVTKILELKKRWYRFFSTNRFLLKFFFNLKKSRQFQLTKSFAKFIKKNHIVNLFKFEFSLRNIIVRSKFSFTLSEADFFIRNGLIYVNGNVVCNPNSVVKLGDVIQCIFSKKNLLFFKNNFNSKLRLTHSVGYRLWRLNRFRNNFYKQSPSGIPDWIYKLIFFYEDVPSYLEVDYICGVISVVKFPTKYYNYNFYFNKFLSFYLMRLYNWKYVI